MSIEKSYEENATAEVHLHADVDFGLNNGVDQAKSGTPYDARDMWRIGKTQELNVSFLRGSALNDTC